MVCETCGLLAESDMLGGEVQGGQCTECQVLVDASLAQQAHGEA